MSGQRLTQSEYTLQQIVRLFGTPISQLAEVGLTRTYLDVYRFCQLENIDYLVLI